MANPIVNLFDNASSGITEVMAGPWRDVRVVKLKPGQPLSLASVREEHVGFVLSGGCQLTAAEGLDFSLRRNHAFALPLGGHAQIIAGQDGTSMLIVTMNVIVRERLWR